MQNFSLQETFSNLLRTIFTNPLRFDFHRNDCPFVKGVRRTAKAGTFAVSNANIHNFHGQLPTSALPLMTLVQGRI